MHSKRKYYASGEPLSPSLTFPGMMLFLAGFVIFMGIITGEIFYRLDFNSRDNYISELAASLTPGILHPQPSTTIFNLSMIVSGMLIILGAIFLQVIAKKLLATLPLVLYGAGFAGVGIFPGNIVPWHGLFAMVLFISGGVAALTSFKIIRSPLYYVFAFLGAVSLVMLVAYQPFVPLLGVGGAERWVLYPVVFFLTGAGGYLAASGKSRSLKNTES